MGEHDVKVDITGDASGFQKATKDGTRALNDFERAAQSADKENKQIGVSAIAIGSAIGLMAGQIVGSGVRALKDLVVASIDQQAAFYKLSQATGISTEALSGWADGAAKEKISVTELSTGLRNLSRSFGEAQGGRGDGGRLFKALDIDVRNFRTLEELMPVVAQRISVLREGAAKTDLVRLLMGGDPNKFIGFLNGGADGLDRMRAAARAAGNEIGGDAAAAADKLDQQMDELSASVRGFGNDIARYAIPRLNELIDRMKEGSVVSGAFRDVLREISKVNPEIAAAFALLEKYNSAEWKAARRKKEMEGNRDARDYHLLDPDYGKKDAPAIGKLGMSDAERAAKAMQREADQLMAGTESGKLDKLNAELERLSVLQKAGFLNAGQRKEAEMQLREEFGKSTLAYKQEMREEEDLRKSREDSEKQFDEMIEARDKARLSFLEAGADQETQAARRMENTMAAVAKEDEEKQNDRERARLDALEAAADMESAAAERMNKTLSDSAKKANDDIVRAIEGTGRKTSRMLAEIAVEGGDAFETLGNAAKEFATELIDIMIYRNAIGPLADAAAGALGNFFGPSASASSASAIVMHGGGVAGSEGDVRIMPPAVFNRAPRYHSGTLSAGEVPAILKRGEGVFTPEQMKALGGGAPQSIRVELVNQGTPQQVQSAKPALDVDGMVIRIVTRDLKNGGPIAQGMQGTFNLRRGGG